MCHLNIKKINTITPIDDTLLPLAISLLRIIPFQAVRYAVCYLETNKEHVIYTH